MAKLLYFGRLVDVFGSQSETCDLPDTINNTAQLRAWLNQARGLGGEVLEPTVRIAINNEIVADPAPISNSDEIAFMPPVGGG